MTSRKLDFRTAGIADADLIVQIGAETFLAAFGPDNTVEDMEKYLAANFNLERIRSQIEDPAASFLLGYDGGQLAAYAMLRAGTPPKSVTSPDPIELVRFYVRPEIIGLGYGSALMTACLRQAQDLGRSTIWLGVWEINQRAIRFYQKWDFKIVGERKFILGDDVQNDFIMARPT